MSLLEKVRNFFYDDEYEEEIEPEKPHHKEKKEKIKIKDFREDRKEKQDISERELFKAERTFNFPMDIEEEEERIPVRREKEQKIEEEEDIKVYKPKFEEPKEQKEVSYSGIRTYAKKEERREEREAPKKFRPTPVISPIYGIMDKNYTKEDLIMDASNDYEAPKKVDYDTVRKKAYSSAYSKSLDDTKGIFFNLDEEKEEVKNEEDEDVKITYNDVTVEEEQKDDDVTIGEKIDEYEKQLEEDEDEFEENQVLSETKEQDLFNLIDNMYNSEDEEDEEDE